MRMKNLIILSALFLMLTATLTSLGGTTSDDTFTLKMTLSNTGLKYTGADSDDYDLGTAMIIAHKSDIDKAGTGFKGDILERTSRQVTLECTQRNPIKTIYNVLSKGKIEKLSNGQIVYEFAIFPADAQLKGKYYYEGRLTLKPIGPGVSVTLTKIKGKNVTLDMTKEYYDGKKTIVDQIAYSIRVNAAIKL